MYKPSVRVLLFDRLDHFLLLRVRDPARDDAAEIWLPPGGIVEPGETLAQAAARETMEETGIPIGEVGPLLATREVSFEFAGSLHHRKELFVSAIAASTTVHFGGQDELERRATRGYRWFATPSELDEVSGSTAPPHLRMLIERALSGRFTPGAPLRLT
ncbi:NUDIX domain-containing protein [Nonomuraea sp. NPDC050202]|uniref:NUDIX domain-containing protein n=1 Tax=Nonomuraea sp. NPDC050202 TaxID=3155035 RepID=UPI0033C5C7D7